MAKTARKTAMWGRDPSIGVKPGRVISIVRRRRKMSIPQLAKVSGLTAEQIRSMESTNKVGRLGCMAVAKALRISPMVIMFPDFDHEDE